MVYSKDYDSKLYLGNTTKNIGNVQFPRNVEPGVIKVFDIFTSLENEGSDLEDGHDDTNVVRMISLEDDDFILDKAIYKLDM